MSKLSKKEIVLLVLLLFVVSGALYYYYYFVPMNEKITALDASILKKEAELNTLQTQQLAIGKAKENIQSLKNGLMGEITDIPTGVDEPELLIFIEEALKDLGDDVNIRFTPEVDPHTFYQVNYALISIKTNYQGIKDMLNNFKNAPYRNSIVMLNANYHEDPTQQLGPDAVTGSDPVLDAMNDEQTEAPDILGTASDDKVLQVEMRVDFYSFAGPLPYKDYPFMIGPYGNPDLFITGLEEAAPEETEE